MVCQRLRRSPLTLLLNICYFIGAPEAASVLFGSNNEGEGDAIETKISFGEQASQPDDSKEGEHAPSEPPTSENAAFLFGSPIKEVPDGR